MEHWFMVLKFHIWLTNTKLFSRENKANIETLQEVFHYIRLSYKLVLKSVSSLTRIFWAMEYWFKALNCQIWLRNTKSFFQESETNVETLQKLYLYIWTCYKFVLQSVRSLRRIFWASEYWLKSLKCQIWLTNTKPFSWESKANLETRQKLSPYISVCYKFFLKFVNSLNRIFRAMEYWFKALKYQIWLRNRKPFFWERKPNFETLHKLYLYIWICYKFVFQSVKSLNWIFWASKYWFKSWKCQIWLTNTKPFSWETKANLKTLQELSRYSWVSYKFVLKFVEA